jgi:glutamate-1-semialdehyde 2,1-aminomutase
MSRACASLAAGDSSTMRVQPYALPLVAERGEGSRLWDIDGQEYIDLNMAYGPLILGHRHPRVVAAVTRQITDNGSQLGFPTVISVRVAEKLKQLFPSIELLRFANSGTEADATAARLARARSWSCSRATTTAGARRSTTATTLRSPTCRTARTARPSPAPPA